MDVRDGFIVGISNYCDRWCERCAFTSDCRLFADCAEMDASLDPGLRVVVEAPPLPAEVPPPPPDWLREVIEDYNQAAQAATAAAAHEGTAAAQSTPVAEREPLPPESVAIGLRGRQYMLGVHQWLVATERQSEAAIGTDVAEPAPRSVAVIRWFHTLISVKIHRALRGLAEADGTDPEDRDHIGSAKVVLLGIDESHAAFLALIESGRVRSADVAPLLADLVWLGESLERVCPTARAFVRPGLDEPDAVARLRASEGM